MPLADSTVGLDLTDGEVVLIAEADLVDPVLACLDAHFADCARFVKNDGLIALVDA